jgi:hypothetical protein
MRYVVSELGWARRGRGGGEGAEAGDAGWISFRHHTARPTLPVQDGEGGVTYLADVPIDGDPHAHIHNFLMNLVVTENGHVGALDSAALSGDRVHEFGAYFRARLAQELRRLGARVGYDKDEQAVVLEAIPTRACKMFSKARRQVLRSAKAYARSQGLDWDSMAAEAKFRILAVTGLAARHAKHGSKNDREIWQAQAEAIGWRHETVLEGVVPEALADGERIDRAYRFAARHLAEDFHRAAVVDHDRLRVHAARGLIGAGIVGGSEDIDRVVELIEDRGIDIDGEPVTLVAGVGGNKLRVTNSAQLRIERDLVDHARRCASDKTGALSSEAIGAAIQRSGLDLSTEPDHGAAQTAAIHALGQGGALTLLTGAAGSGKTTLLQPLVAAWKAGRRPARIADHRPPDDPAGP